MATTEKGSAIGFFSQPERELQGVCHELLEIIEGQEYIIEDAQFAANYGSKIVESGDVATRGSSSRFEQEIRQMIRHMEEAKAIAEDQYRNTFNCRRARERAGFEVER